MPTQQDKRHDLFQGLEQSPEVAVPQVQHELATACFNIRLEHRVDGAGFAQVAHLAVKEGLGASPRLMVQHTHCKQLRGGPVVKP